MPPSKENRLQMAISAYKKGQIKSRNYAAKVFAVAESTLRERLHGIKARAETRANGHRLTHIEEEVLIKRLLDTDKRGFSIQPEFLRVMAQILLRERLCDSTAILGPNWASRFIKRHP
jgi:hypothetical protein